MSLMIDGIDLGEIGIRAWALAPGSETSRREPHHDGLCYAFFRIAIIAMIDPSL